MSNENSITLSSDIFADLREKFDAQLAHVLLAMQSYDIKSGSVSLKLNIDLTDTPTFDFDIKSSMAIKDKLGGFIRRENTRVEWDVKNHTWALVDEGPNLFDA